jgi:hypothetical protein
MAGLVPAISIHVAKRCITNRDARDKRGHDVAGLVRITSQ